MAQAFKVFRQSEWSSFNESGVFSGSEHDLRDGFIHMCTENQLERIVSKYFSAEASVVLATFDIESLGDKLRFEEAGDGELYPHLYRTLHLKELKAFNEHVVSHEE